MKITILENGDEAPYEDLLNECAFSSVQFSLDWCNVVREIGEDQPYFVAALEGNRVVGVLPLYLYSSKLGNLLTTNAWHTISGIICSREVHRRDVCRALLDKSVVLARELDCTFLSVNTNPFIDDEDCYSEFLQPDYVMENFVQYVKLNEVLDQDGNFVHPNYTQRSNLSRNLTKAKREQVVISDEQSQEKVNQCFDIHEKRMKELGSFPIPKRLFDSVLKNVTLKGKGKFLYAFYQGKMVAACLFLSSKRILDVYMMSMDSEFCGLGSNYLLTEYMLKWAYKNGIAILHWMSSPRRGDGVYKWKQQWCSRERTFLYLTKVLGDISHLQKMDCRELNNAYKFHYLLPFNLLRNPDAKFTTKDELASFMQSLPCE